jgi:hypothetical protein
MAMSKGSPIIPVRIPVELLAELDAKIDTVNDRRKDEPYRRSSFIIAAIREKLDKYKRGNKKTEQNEADVASPGAEQPNTSPNVE